MTEVKVMAAWCPVTVLARDEAGRINQVVCPNTSCGQPAVVQADGKIVCPNCTPLAEHIHTLLADGYERLVNQHG